MLRSPRPHRPCPDSPASALPSAWPGESRWPTGEVTVSNKPPGAARRPAACLRESLRSARPAEPPQTFSCRTRTRDSMRNHRMRSVSHSVTQRKTLEYGHTGISAETGRRRVMFAPPHCGRLSSPGHRGRWAMAPAYRWRKNVLFSIQATNPYGNRAANLQATSGSACISRQKQAACPHAGPW